MPQTFLTLGGITFAGLEVPERINWGGDQVLVKQILVGGVRVLDAMGRDDDPIEWEGWFMGADAMSRAQFLNTLRIQGAQTTLSWDQLNFTVVIKSFKPSYEFAYRIPYRISCEIVQDNATPTTQGVFSDIDDQMANDFGTATILGGQIGNTSLTGLLGTLGTAIGAVSTFANASQSTLSGVQQPLAATQLQVNTLLASAINTTTNVTTLGGVLPATPAVQSINAMAIQAASFEQQVPLLSLQAVLGRMNNNLGGIRSNSTTVTTAGGNLMSIASQKYGDPTSWTAIAKANGLTDPVIQGIQTLTVPNTPDTAGGLLGN